MSENERLKKEIGLLKQRLVFLNEILLENERLTSLFSFKQKSSYKVIAARVIARAADSWSSCAIVNKGSLNGVKLDLVAVTHLGLVGRVIEVSKNATKIALLNDPTLSVSAVVQRSRQEGLVCGTLGLHLMMKYLPKDSDIKAGDIITTSGLSHIYPKGLLIGTVVDLGEEFSGLSHYAIIKPAVNLSSLEEVLLIVH